MKPSATTSRGLYPATAFASASSHSAREAKSPGGSTKVGIPAASARCRPRISPRSAPTATTCTPYDESWLASRSACSVDPSPDTSPTTRQGSVATSATVRNDSPRPRRRDPRTPVRRPGTAGRDLQSGRGAEPGGGRALLLALTGIVLSWSLLPWGPLGLALEIAAVYLGVRTLRRGRASGRPAPGALAAVVAGGMAVLF